MGHLGQGKRTPGQGREVLARTARVWSASRNQAEAAPELEALERAEVQARQERDCAAHQARLDAQAERLRGLSPAQRAQLSRNEEAKAAQIRIEHDTLRRRADQRAFDAAGTERVNAERAAQMAGVRQLKNGEWVVGDDLGILEEGVR